MFIDNILIPLINANFFASGNLVQSQSEDDQNRPSVWSRARNFVRPQKFKYRNVILGNFGFFDNPHLSPIWTFLHWESMFYLKAELAKMGTKVGLEKILHISFFLFRTVFQVILGNFDFCSGWGILLSNQYLWNHACVWDGWGTLQKIITESDVAWHSCYLLCKIVWECMPKKLRSATRMIRWPKCFLKSAVFSVTH